MLAFLDPDPHKRIRISTDFLFQMVSCVRYVRRMFSDEVLRDMVGSGEVVAEIEREWEQLIKDRNCLRQIFPNGNSKVPYYPRHSEVPNRPWGGGGRVKNPYIFLPLFSHFRSNHSGNSIF